jgi:predicted dehydrogenase
VMNYRAGIVGCGRIGSEFDDDPKRKMTSSHAGAYSSAKGIDLVAVCDLDKEKLEKCSARWHVPALYQDYKEMLHKEALDILSICTWNSTHLEILREAVSRGVKAIFCEKPISDSLRNADEIIRLCNENGVILQIDHQRRFDRFHQEVRKFIQDGGLGRIQQVTFYYTAGIANTGSHMFDLLRFFFGDVEWVRTIYSHNKSPSQDDPNIDGIVKFKSGHLGTIQACDVNDFLILEMDCIGTNGRLDLTRSGFDLKFHCIAESNLFSGYKEIYPGTPPIDKDTPRQFMINGVQHLLECLKEGKKSISSGEDGQAALELICACHESARADGEKITLPLANRDIEIKSS